MPKSGFSRNNPTAVEVVNDVDNPINNAGLPTSLGQKTKANSTSVTLANDQGAVTTNMQRATASTVTAVASSATSVQIVAANAARLGLSIYNDSTYSLYLRYGSGAASSSDFSVLLQSGALYEVPDRSVTLEVRGVWSSANGNARATEAT